MARRLRVIAGSAGGLHLVAPNGARPTTDRAKEALFASLGAAVVDANVLDLFAGSGALGIEALSRGAERSTFVERDRDAIAAIRRNLATAGFVDRADVREQTVGTFLSGPRSGGRDAGGPFDLVFLDAPYDLGAPVLAGHLADIEAGGWLESDATVVVERRKGDLLALPSRWLVAGERTYGDTLLLVATV
ncbi:MAG: 16S rRNA (guanine(966)-N(2))-methyltransferase RsmD [Acidimicrobiia bacterium]